MGVYGIAKWRETNLVPVCFYFKLYGPFYEWVATVSRLHSHYEGSLLVTTQFPGVPGTHLEPPSGIEPKTPGLGIQCPNH